MGNNKSNAAIARGNNHLQDDGELTPLHALLSMELKILNTPLMLVLEKGEKINKALLIPTSIEKSSGGTVKEIISDIERISQGTVDDSELRKLLSDSQQEDGIEDIEISLCMAYLYLELTNEGIEKTEYAFQLYADLKNVLPENLKNIIHFESISFSIWNTDRKKILERMNLILPDQYLE